MTEREAHSSQKDAERKTSREICLPDSWGKQRALQQADKSERERVKVEERRRGQAGGHEPTCRLGQKLWLQRGEVRRREEEF